MTQIFLVRHGQSEGNLFRRVQGQTDVELTADGRAQLPYLTKRFAETPLAAVYTSPLRRAEETAAAIVGGWDIPVFADKRLIEMCFGAWEMRPWGEVNLESPELKRAFLHDPDRWHVPGSEAHTAVQKRMLAAMTDIARANDGKTVAVACHGMAIRAFLARILGVPSERIFEDVPLVNNTSVTLLRFENDTFSVLYVNDTTHLPAPPYTPFRENGKAGGPRCYDLRYRPFDPDAGQERYIACYRDAWRGAHGTTEGFDASACWLSAQLHSAEAPGCITEALVENEFAGILTLDERRGRERGIGWATVELEVGLDTFRVVDEEDPRKHQLHTERYTVPASTVEAIRKTKERGCRVIAVGTTSVRSLESAWDDATQAPIPRERASTNLFILPGYEFHVVDALITNFHVPRSTLMMLVSAFSTRDNIMKAYRHAIKHDYRLLSFGDAMFIH